MHTQNLEPLELERYSRHLALPRFGEQGQLRLKQASVLIVGLGGLGSVSSLYLGAAGVGKIGLIEDDHVSLSNLQRQILYTTDEVGQSKLALAAQNLKAHNPAVAIKTYPHRLTKDNANGIVEAYDLVVDGTDNLVTRRVINQACVALDRPYIYGAVNLFDGQVSVFHAAQGPCWACIFPDNLQEPPAKRPEQLAVLNTVPAVIGALQATEAIKWIVGMGQTLIGRLLIYNALQVSFDRIDIEKNHRCPVCGY